MDDPEVSRNSSLAASTSNINKSDENTNAFGNDEDWDAGN